jgi:serine/threonine-protein kinase RsbW
MEQESMAGREEGFGTSTDSLVLGAAIDEVARATAWLEGLAERDSWPEHVRFALQLGLEEALTNAIEHGLKGRGADAAITVSYVRTPKAVRLRVVDNGTPFDPTSLEETPVPESIESAAVGGHGIRLMKRLLDEFSYRRVGQRNQLTLGVVTGS